MKLPTFKREVIKRDLLTLTISLLGGLVANWLNMPAGFLAGGAISVSIAALSGMKLGLSEPLINVSLIGVGMAVGTNVASNSLELISQWPISMLGLFIMLFFIVSLTGFVLMRIFGFDRTTAYYAAMPGHLSLVMSIVVKQNSNSQETTKIALIMSVRVLVLTILLPIGAMVGGTLPANIGNPGPTISLWQLIMLAIACTAGGGILQILRVPGGLVLGVILVGIVGKLAGYYQGVLPGPLTGLAFIAMGALIGSRMSSVSWTELRHSAFAGLVVTLISVGLVTGTALIIGQFMHMPLGQIWLGIAPGGLEAMAALGLAFGYDSTFIAAHHTWRLLILGITIPIFAPFFTKRANRGNAPESDNPR